MTYGPYLLPDVTVSLAAFAALMILIHRLRVRQNQEMLTHILRNTLSCVAIFLLVRTLFWVTGLVLFQQIFLIVAAAIPLMVLLLSEALMRRHAPLWCKVLFVGGLIAVIVATLWPGFASTGDYARVLLAYQLGCFILIVWLVIGRDRASLSASENERIAAVSLSLIFILPFLISDFRTIFFELPVRLSGLAILVTCWLSLNLNRPRRNKSRMLFSIFLVMGFAALAGVILARQFDLTWVGMAQSGAIVAALILLVEIIRDSGLIAEDAKYNAVITEIGSQALSSLTGYLDLLAQKGVLADVLIVSSDQLEEFDQPALRTLIADKNFITSDDLPTQSGEETMAQSQMRHLFERYGANQVYLVANEPMQLAFARAPGFLTAEIDPNLSAAFGMSRLIAARK